MIKKMKGEGGGPLSRLIEVNDWRKKSGLTCSFVVFTLLNAVMLIVGVNTMDDCPEEEMIPVYLIGINEKYE